MQTIGKIGAMSRIPMYHPNSAFNATAPASNLSKQYEFLPTKTIVDAVAQHGFYVRDYRQARTKNLASAQVAKHIVWLRKENQEPIDDVYPEVIMINSHNGKNRLKFLIGFLRLVCENGLVAGQVFDGWDGLTHKTYNPLDKIIEQVHGMADHANKKLDTIQAMKDRLLNEDEFNVFIRQATELTPNRVYANELELNSMRRWEDRGQDLWRVFNRTQENLLKGGTYTLTRNGRVRRTRSVTNLDKTIDLNQKLWKLAESFLPQPSVNENTYLLAA